MSTHDMNIANQGFPAFRSDLNLALAALVSNNASATEPSTTFAHMWWPDTANDLLKQRNAADSAWIDRGKLSAVNFGLASLSASQTFTAGQRGEVTTLTDAASIATDLALSNNFAVTLGGNRTLANPTNIVAGQSGSIKVAQDATGSRTLAFGSYWKFVGGVAPVLSTAASAIDRIDYYVASSTEIHAVVSLDVK